MIEIDTSDRTEQRKFGLVMAVAIAILGLIRWAFKGFVGFPVYFMGVAAVFLVLGLVAPGALRPVFVAWIKFAIVLNWVVTHLLLGIIFYLIITPTRLAAAPFMADPLKRAWRPDDASYWEDPEEQPEEFDRYRKQF